MITEIVIFSIPDGMTREEVVANYRRSAPAWRANPDLIRKNYLYDAESRRAGGVYLWRTMEAARRARDAAWLERVRRNYGSEPVVQHFETPLVTDNAIVETIDEEGDQRRYSPAECTGVTVGTVTGQPDRKHVSTSYVKRQNLSMRIVSAASPA